MPAELLASWKASSFGPTWDSYVVGGQPWAVPVDAATQVGVLRPDLLRAIPRTWAEVPGLAREHRVALCLGGPHAFLTAFLAPEVQAGLVPAHAGQPAHAAAWHSPPVDQAWGGYYSSTGRSLEAAAVIARINEDYRALEGI